MRDLRIISVSDSIEVLSAERIPLSSGGDSDSLRVFCLGKCINLSRVIINGRGFDDFIVLSETSFMLTLPSDMLTLAISEMDISATSSALTDTGKSAITFELSKTFSSITGIEKLVQQVLKTLLSKTGSNRFDIAAGGGLVDLLSSINLSASGKSKVSAILQQSISATRDQMLVSQLGQTLPAEEKLLSLELSSLTFSPLTTEVSASIKLISFAGEDFAIPLTL